jgi:hypothetical protein
MRLYKREDFIKLPVNTVYSRTDLEYNLFYGLYCKTSGKDWLPDFIEQDLISETGFPAGITDGYESEEYFKRKMNAFEYFETNLNSAGREGYFDDDMVYVVWDKNDINKLIDYLKKCL